MNWQQFLFNACFQVWKGVLTSWITHLLHRRRKPSYMMTYQQRSRHPNMKMLKSQATSTCKNICLLRIEVSLDTALNYLLLFPEDTHTPNKCEAHCEQWEIGHLGERWRPDFRIQTTIQTTCVLKPFRNMLLWNTVYRSWLQFRVC